MMRGLSAFLLPDLLALLGDGGSVKILAMDSQSEGMSEDSESQPSQLPEGNPPRLVIARSTNSAAQTIVLVDRDHSMEAFVPAKVLEVLRTQLRYKSLARLRGSVLRLVKYQFVTRARCLASGQLEDSAASNWRTSVSMAASSRRDQRLYLWIEELSVVDDNELVVDPLLDVVEDAEIARLLGGQTNAELETRLAIRQKLPPLPAAASEAASVPPRFDDGNPLTDMDCVIPEDQERELDEQDGWGPPPAVHSQLLPTDSQLIDENGSVAMSELQDTSLISDLGERGRSEGGASAFFPFERTSPNAEATSQLDGSAAEKRQQHMRQRAGTRQDQLSGSETEDEYGTRNSFDGNDSGNDEPDGSPGSVDVPIDLTGDEDDESPENASQALTRADYIYDDSELYTQPPDTSAGFQQTQEKSWFQSREEEEVDQIGRSQPDSETQVLDDPHLQTQPPDTPADHQLSQDSAIPPREGQAHKIQADGGTQLWDAPAATARTQKDIAAQLSSRTQLQDALNDISGRSVEAPDAEEAQRDTGTRPLDAIDDTSDHSRQAQDDQETQADAGTPRPDAQDKAPVHSSSEDADIDQPRGLGSFFRRLASNLGMVSSHRESTDRPRDDSPGAKESDTQPSKGSVESGAQVTREGEPQAATAAENTVSGENSDNSQSDNGDDEDGGEPSQNPGAFVDVEMWQTQATDVVDSRDNDNEHPPSSPPSSSAEDYGYEQDMNEDVEMTTDAAELTTIASRMGVARVSVDTSQVSDDKDHAEAPASASAKTPPGGALNQTPATMGKKRSSPQDMRDEVEAGSAQQGARQTSSSCAPSARVSSASSPALPAAIGRESQVEAAHNQQRADKEGEEATEDEQSSARKRRRLGRVLKLSSPRRRSSTDTQTTGPKGSSTYALSPSRGRLWARLGNADSPSTAARVPAPTSVRPSKRFEAFFPPLRMDRIMKLIAEKE